MKREIIESIGAYIMANVAAVKFTGIWNRQVEFIADETPFEMPSAFIELMPIGWATKIKLGSSESMSTKKRLTTLLKFNVHVVTSETDINDLSNLDISDDVGSALHGAHIPELGNTEIRWISTTPNHDHSEIMDSVESFEMELIMTG